MSTPLRAAGARRLPRLAGDAVVRARLRLVPRRAPRAARAPFVALVSLVLLAGVVGLLVFNTQMQQASFRATALEARAARLHAQEQALRMRLDSLRSPQRVAVRAQELGMVPLVNPAFLRLGDGRTLGDPVPARPADQQRLDPLPTRKPAALRVPPVWVEAPPPPEGPDSGADGVPTDDAAPPAGTTGGPSTRP